MSANLNTSFPVIPRSLIKACLLSTPVLYILMLITVYSSTALRSNFGRLLDMRLIWSAGQAEKLLDSISSHPDFAPGSTLKKLVLFYCLDTLFALSYAPALYYTFSCLYIHGLSSFPSIFSSSSSSSSSPPLSSPPTVPLSRQVLSYLPFLGAFFDLLENASLLVTILQYMSRTSGAALTVVSIRSPSYYLLGAVGGFSTFFKWNFLAVVPVVVLVREGLLLTFVSDVVARLVTLVGGGNDDPMMREALEEESRIEREQANELRKEIAEAKARGGGEHVALQRELDELLFAIYYKEQYKYEKKKRVQEDDAKKKKKD